MALDLRLALIASHEGTNAQTVIDACADHDLAANVVLVVSNNSASGALRRARTQRIPSAHLSGATHPDVDELDQAMLRELQIHDANLIVLAGYLKKLGPRTLAAYAGRVINVHPALLPKYGGQGMYGRFVHEAVLESGDRETGATVHLVDDEYDHGQVLSQRAVEVLPGDDVDALAARVLDVEHRLLVDTLNAIATGSIELSGSS